MGVRRKIDVTWFIQATTTQGQDESKVMLESHAHPREHFPHYDYFLEQRRTSGWWPHSINERQEHLNMNWTFANILPGHREPLWRSYWWSRTRARGLEHRLESRIPRFAQLNMRAPDLMGQYVQFRLGPRPVREYQAMLGLPFSRVEFSRRKGSTDG